MENRMKKLPSQWGYSSFAGLLISAVSMLVLHGLQPDLSLLDDAMSYYVHGYQGWLLPASLIGIGLGSAALAAGLCRVIKGTRAKTGVIFIGFWALGLTAAVIFPTDPIGSWEQPPSFNGILHFMGAITAFISITLASILLSRTFMGHSRWKNVGKALVFVTIFQIVAFAALTVSTLTIFIGDGPPFYFGLTERLLFLTSICWLSLATVGLFNNEKKPPVEPAAKFSNQITTR